MKRITIFFITAFLLAAQFSFARGAAASSKEASPVTVYGLKGPSGVALLSMIDKAWTFPGYDVSFELLPSADLMAGRLLSGEAKIGILPPNTAAKLYASGAKVQIAAVTGGGMLSLLTSAPDIKRLSDLRARRVVCAGAGAVPEYVFRKILDKNGIPPATVNLDFSLAYPEIAASLIAGRIETALLPEPFATQARAGNTALHDVVNIQAEWERVGGSASYPMTCLVVNADFARDNYGFVQSLLEGCRASISYAVSNPGETGLLAEKHDLGLRSPIVSASIPKSAYNYMAARDARPLLEALFKAFLEYDAASIGGALPADGFYFD